MSIIVYMRQDMVDNFNAFNIDYKTAVEKMTDDNGIPGRVMTFSSNDAFYKTIESLKTAQYCDNGSVIAKNRKFNKWFRSLRDVMGFFDATEYVKQQGDLDYLTSFLRYGGVVRLEGCDDDFVGLTQDAKMREAIKKLIDKQN